MNRQSQHDTSSSKIPPIVFAAFLLPGMFFLFSCTGDTQNLPHDAGREVQDSESEQETPDTSSDSKETEPSEETYEMLCDDNATAVLDNGGKIQNNVWGFISSSFAGYTQCVFFDTADPDVFGWRWNLDGKSDYPSYPRIEFGWNPWDKASATEVLPRRISSVSSLIVSFEKELTSDGLYNTAFDIWLTGPDARYSDTIVGEIMVWLDGTQTQSAQLTADNITIGSEIYDFYKNTAWNDFPYLAFVQKSDNWNGAIDIVPFISYLVENGHLSVDAYIAEVELGNEIWSGSGTMLVKDFSVTVQ